ncbi:bifunctional oligoribonuclease/PAP phosphatase NrnA [Phascolarctobacterium sp.]|uniref:DHH family phosphoesterase n=1 Tax=Phascolarctobacterium sp. TaxID=2049039 RepID=UPI0030775108
MSKHCSLQETADVLKSAKKIVLCSHVSPDGDTLGSTLGLMKALQKLGKDVIVTADDDISKVYKFLPGIENFVRFRDEERIDADLLVVIDASSLDRAGNVAQCVKAPKMLNIDHHISNTEYADYLYLDTVAAATGEIMYELIKVLGTEIDVEMAICLYTALYTDCGSFKYSNTMPKTMRIAAELLELGVKPNEISDSMEIKPRSNIEMLTRVLETLTFDADGKIAYISISNEMYDKDVDTDTFISYPRYIEGVEVAIMFKAVENALTRVSMRSRNLDVSGIAIAFGGGGHLRAAGCTIMAALPEAQKQLLQALKDQLV